MKREALTKSPEICPVPKVISEDLTRREAILAFVWSRMRVPDALTNRFTVETLT